MKPFLLLGLIAVVAHANIVFTQATPDPSLNALDITGSRVADDFTLAGSSTLASISFYYAYASNGMATDLSNLTYAVYANNAGTLGSLLRTETVAIAAGNITPQNALCSDCASASFAITNLPLAAGTYWLELHADTTLTGGNGGNPIYWEVATPNASYAARWDQGALVTPNSALPAGFDQYVFQLSDNAPEPGAVGLILLGMLGCLLKTRCRHPDR